MAADKYEDIKVVCVDDEHYIAESINDYLAADYDCRSFIEPSEALEQLRIKHADILIVDYRMPGINGFEILQCAYRENLCKSAMLLTAYADKELLKDVLNEGLVDYVLEKPLDLTILSSKLSELAEKIRLERDKISDEQRIADIFRLLSDENFDIEFIGREGDLGALWNQAVQAAPTDENVLITGETGTGKDVLAKKIHLHSSRAQQPFIRINCGSIPPSLIESELFGHEKGAFTGAVSRKLGRIELAHRGTLFLDEIGELPPELQTRLLHVVEDKALIRVGGTVRRGVDFRLISATNRPLESLNEESFRRDLYYRISTVHLDLPPLRERKKDILLFVLSMVRIYSKRFIGRELEISSEALRLLSTAPWPGNIRELDNVIKRVIMLKGGDDGMLLASDFYSSVRTESSSLNDLIRALADEIMTKQYSIQDIEQDVLAHILDRCGGRVMEAHRVSGVPKDRFYRLAGRKNERK